MIYSWWQKLEKDRKSAEEKEKIFAPAPTNVPSLEELKERGEISEEAASPPPTNVPPLEE